MGPQWNLKRHPKPFPVPLLLCHPSRCLNWWNRWRWLSILDAMFELQWWCLFTVLQLCIQNNPNEARNMLLQNPQLAYALLQAQVVMRIVDPQVAIVRISNIKWILHVLYLMLHYFNRQCCTEKALVERRWNGGDKLPRLLLHTSNLAAPDSRSNCSSPALLATFNSSYCCFADDQWFAHRINVSNYKASTSRQSGDGTPFNGPAADGPTKHWTIIVSCPRWRWDTNGMNDWNTGGVVITIADVDYRQGVRGPPPTIPPPSVPPKVLIYASVAV